MRTFKEAKAMAKSFRESLAVKHVLLSHSESLEIVAKAAGYADWNTLSAKLKEESEAAGRVSCSFCAKSNVRSLIEGGCSRDRGARLSCVFICEECVSLCAQVNAGFLGDAPS